MSGVAANALLAKRPWPRPRTATKKHPRHDARGQSRAVVGAAMPPVKPDTLSASKNSPPNSSKSLTSALPDRRWTAQPYCRGPPDLGQHGPGLAPAAVQPGRSPVGASHLHGPPGPGRVPPGPDRGPPAQIRAVAASTSSAVTILRPPLPPPTTIRCASPHLRREQPPPSLAIAAGPSSKSP
nr:uncharacterized protein LOC127348062 [Lolium perenne]